MISHSISPRLVDTPDTAPERRLIPVTLVFSMTVAPRLRAPMTIAMVVLSGTVWPSSGMWTAPTTSSVRIRGHISPASCGLMVCISTPKLLAIDVWRLSSSRRPSVRATVILPVRLKPGSCPVSASNREYSSTPCREMSVSDREWRS